jgi:NADH dehydrogenase
MELTLIDRNNFHLFTPLLYQVATGELPPHAVAYPLRIPLARRGWRFVRAEVTAVDIDARVIRTSEGDFPYDHAVLVPGSISNDFGIPGVKEYALVVKWLTDGRALRHRILSVFEEAAAEPDPEKRRALLSFAVVGAGPVGVELSASMRDLMDHTLRGIYPSIDFAREPHITLFDGADRVVPAMDPRMSRIALRRLQKLGVDVRLKTLASEVTADGLRLKDGAFVHARTVIWAGGVKSNPLLASLAIPKSRDGRLVVDRFFRANGRDDVLALGDAAAFDFNGAALPMLAQVAVLEAPSAAKNVAHLVRGEPLEEYRYHRKGDLVALGRTSAAAEFARPVKLVLGGFLAWGVWRVNYLMQLVGTRNRGTLLVEWLLSYFSRRIVVDIP